MGSTALKCRVWIECASRAELARFVEHLRLEFGWEVQDPEPGRRHWIGTFSSGTAVFRVAARDGENRADLLLADFDGDARLVRVDVFEPGAPSLAVLNAQLAGVRSAA